jgi:ABC-2 type transport system permease protein
MSAVATTPAAAPLSLPRPPLARLTYVELRKMTDTRAGFWLLLVTLLLALAGLILTIAFAPDEDRDFKSLFRTTMDLTSLLASVLAILVVTSEWSQRTALSTFTLVPKRERVITAKGLAVIVFALVISVNCLLLGVIGTLVSSGADRWTLSLGEFATGTLLQTLGMLGAFAIGLALMSSAPAIVLAYVLPIVFAILAETIPGFRDTADWLDTTAPAEALWLDAGDGTAWAQLATTWGIWLGIPLAVGLARLRRVELA